MIGEVIDHYRILELIGRGAMGVVYKALDLNLDRPVAIKLMSAEVRDDPAFVERFRQEARTQGSLNHPNIAMLFDYFVHDGTPVVVMEFIDGESFEQLIRRRGPIPARETIYFFKQALRGVAAAHRAGIIHRDLKTANLMITWGDIVKVMDFGIAKRQSATGATKASTSIGSPLYMAPEQILGRAIDCRTDVYALGITLYQLLSGQPPFNPRGKTEYSVLNAHVNDLPEPPTVHFRDIPQPLVDVVMRALAKEPEARFQSVDDFMRALPDVTPTNAAAPRVKPMGPVAMPEGPTGTVKIPQAGPTGTVAIARRGPTATKSIPREDPTLQRSQPLSPAPSSRVTAVSPARSHAQQGRELAPSGLIQRLRGHRLAFVAIFVAALAISGMVRHAQLLRATSRIASPDFNIPRVTQRQLPTPLRGPVSTETTTGAPRVASSRLDPPAGLSTDETSGSAAARMTSPPATTTAPARPGLTGTWRGAYVDAEGNELLRVTSLSIGRVHDDGGIEGTLQYQAASGEGQCKLRPRGSTYWVANRRLQLSPEGCSSHYPKELGVPLDFEGVNPQANMLKNGRIEAPTGGFIRVYLKRSIGEDMPSPESTHPPAHHSTLAERLRFGRSYLASVSGPPSALP